MKQRRKNKPICEKCEILQQDEETKLYSCSHGFKEIEDLQVLDVDTCKFFTKKAWILK